MSQKNQKEELPMLDKIFAFIIALSIIFCIYGLINYPRFIKINYPTEEGQEVTKDYSTLIAMTVLELGTPFATVGLYKYIKKEEEIAQKMKTKREAEEKEENKDDDKKE